jgi:hypothetical protein
VEPARWLSELASSSRSINPSAKVFAVTPSRAHSMARWRMKLMPAPLPAA